MIYNKASNPYCGGMYSQPVPQIMQQMMPSMMSQGMPQMTPYDQAGYMPEDMMPGSAEALPVMPTGMPLGPQTSPMPVGPSFPIYEESASLAPSTPDAALVPQTVLSVQYTQGFLRTQIGKRVRVEFLLGTNMLTDRIGTLIEVGASYIVLRLSDSDDYLMADLYSIKFVTIFR